MSGGYVGLALVDHSTRIAALEHKVESLMEAKGDDAIASMGELYERIRSWQKTLPNTGDIMLLQQSERVCCELNTLFGMVMARHQKDVEKKMLEAYHV